MLCFSSSLKCFLILDNFGSVVHISYFTLLTNLPQSLLFSIDGLIAFRKFRLYSILLRVFLAKNHIMLFLYNFKICFNSSHSSFTLFPISCTPNFTATQRLQNHLIDRSLSRLILKSILLSLFYFLELLIIFMGFSFQNY